MKGSRKQMSLGGAAVTYSSFQKNCGTIYITFTILIIKKKFKFIYFERERERERTSGGRAGREGRERIPSRLHTTSPEPDVGLELNEP